MQSYLMKLRQSTFVKDNIILFVGSFLAGILGFVYHALMGRFLGVADYGILGTIFAAFYFFNASFVNTLQTSIAQFTSRFSAKKETGKIAYLVRRACWKIFLLGLVFFFLYTISLPWISSYLSIEKDILFISGFLFLVTLFVSVGRGIMQGLQSFLDLSLSNIIEGVAKLLLAFASVYLGYRLRGAMVAVILTYVIVILFFWKPLKPFFSQTPTAFPTKGIYTYSLPVFFMIVSLTLFFSVDVILIKHFFSETEAGLYSALSLLGKIIFFGTFSIAQVMFPKVSSNHAQGKPSLYLFYYSLLVILLCLFIALFVYFFFPKLLVTLLFGESFFAMIPLVGRVALFMSLISLLYLISYYLISLEKFTFIFLLLVFNILQIILVYYFHSTLQHVLFMFNLLIATLIVLVVLLHFPSFFSFRKTIHQHSR